MLALITLAGVFDLLRQADARVTAVAWTLQTANAALCRDVGALPGFSVEALDQYPPAQRAEASDALGLGDLPQVSAVAPGSAAARAGLIVGDRIVAINDKPVAHGVGKARNYDVAASVEAALAAGLDHPPVKMTLSSRTVSLMGDTGCRSAVQLVPPGRFDARADGYRVQISGSMYEFAANDSELAFIIAHELAHNLFPEARLAPGGGGAQRAAELAADRRATAMMRRAGYDLAVVVPLLKRFARKTPLSWLDGTHPAWRSRIEAAAAAVAAASAISPGSP